jgi:hypothetical protein
MGNSESRAQLSEKFGEFVNDKSGDREVISCIFDVPVTVEDVFEILSPEFIRELRKSQPFKLRDMIHFICIPHFPKPLPLVIFLVSILISNLMIQLINCIFKGTGTQD